MLRKLKIRSSDILIRVEHISIGLKKNVRVLFISDLHFTSRSIHSAKEIVKKSIERDPQLIILGGDYYDTSRGFKLFEKLVLELSQITKMIVIPGNHDFYFGIRKLEEIVQENNCEWLHGGSIKIDLSGITLQVDNGENTKASAADLRIYCCHNPSGFSQITSDHDLGLAGHLHGGQIVFWEKRGKMYPGALFYKWNGLSFIKNEVPIYVSRGLGDTIPIRYNCPKEIIEINIK